MSWYGCRVRVPCSESVLRRPDEYDRCCDGPDETSGRVAVKLDLSMGSYAAILLSVRALSRLPSTTHVALARFMLYTRPTK